jgi:aryl-alcohol dehydrogenase-like predicted oxidoreductase
MDYRKLGMSDLEVSTVALGCWAIGGWWWGGTDKADAIAAIRTAPDVGINLIDTAPAYGWGVAEQLVGEALEGRRDQVYIATKCGLIWDREEGQYFFESEGKRVYKCLKKDSIFREVEGSLKRLRTDHIDLYQCHWPDRSTPLEETMDALTTLRDQGKIRAIGVSNFTASMHAECEKHGPLHSSQPRYSMLDRKIEKDVLPYCRKNRVGVIVYSPLEQGILTGKVTPDREFAEGDYRVHQPWFQKKNLTRVLEALDRIRLVADKRGKSLAQLAIAWVLSQPGITSAIVGARNPQQVEHNAGAGEWQLTRSELDQIDAEIMRLGDPER